MNWLLRHKKRILFDLIVGLLGLTLIFSGLQLKVIPSDFPAPPIKTVWTFGTLQADTLVRDATCNITDSANITATLQALVNLASSKGGGKIEIRDAGKYPLNATVNLSSNITIEGLGKSVYFYNDGSTPLFATGASDSCVFRNFSTDTGGISTATGTRWLWENIHVGSTFYARQTIYESDTYVTSNITNLISSNITAPTGRTSTVCVAAFNASVREKAQADYLCDGVNDQVEIQAAIDELEAGNGGILNLSAGTFTTNATINVNHSGITIRGAGRYEAVLYGTGGTQITTEPWPASFNAFFTLDNTIDGGDFGSIQDLTLVSNVGASRPYYGIYIIGADDLLIRNVYIENCATAAIGAVTVNTNLHVLDSYLERCGRAIQVITGSPTYGLIIQNCVIAGANDVSIWIENPQNQVIIANNNLSAGSTYNAIRLTNVTSGRVLIVGNQIYGNGSQTTSAISVVNSNYVGIFSNIIYGAVNNLYCIDIDNTSNYISVQSNQITGYATRGVYVTAGGNANGKISGNLGHVTESSGVGVGTGAQQTIAHGLAFTPLISQIGVFSDNFTGVAFQTATPDATNIYVTATGDSAWHWGTIGK